MSVTLDTSIALTSLAQVKRSLRIETSTEHDDRLTELINGVSDRIRRICNRNFVAADYREFWSGSNERTIVVKNRPIIDCFRVAYGIADGLEIQFSGTAIRATVQVNDTGIRLYSQVAAGTETETEVSFANYPTISTAVTQINTVSGWTATTTNDWSSYELHPLAGRDAMTAPIRLTYPDSDDDTYAVNYDSGMIQFGHSLGSDGFDTDRGGFIDVPAGRRNLMVYYKGGYATIPADLASLASEAAARAFQMGAHDRTVQSEGLGDHSVSLGGATEEIQFNEAQRESLRRWGNLPIGSEVS